MKVAEVSSKLVISEATSESWKKMYSGLGPVELWLALAERRERAVERIAADRTLEKQMPQGRVKKV